MSDLTFNIHDLTSLPNAVLVQMAGAIDASTVVNFQSKLENLQLNGVKRFILDMGDIRYVNSTGLGSLVRLADQLESEGGGFALVKIHPKVKVVFDMLGLHAFFKIYNSQQDAERDLAEGAEGEEQKAAPAGAQAADAPGSAVQPSGTHGPPAGAQPPQPPPGATAPPPPPPGMRAGAPPPASGVFQPKAITCQNCGVTLKIAQPGTFKCSRCFTVFSVHPGGQVEFQLRTRPTPLQMNLTCAEECKQGLVAFLYPIAQRVGFHPERIKMFQHSIYEIVTAITAHAYGNNPQNTYSVLIAPVQGEVNIKFADHGRRFEAANGQLFNYTRQVVAGFDLKPHPQGGNIITLKMRAQ